jgi:hypothetical protein
MQPITYQGKTLVLQQSAYLSEDAMTYQAYAQDARGDEYKVIWQCKKFDDGDILTDESEMCDWDKFTVEKL